MKLVALILLIVLVVCAVWRVSCKYFNIPWPFLAFVGFGKNPYMLVFCHPDEIARRSGVKDSDKVLDLGCGAGRISIPLAKLCGENGSVLGLDLQQRMVSKAIRFSKENKFEDITEFKVFDVCKEDLDTIFDKIVIVTVLGEIPNVSSVIKKLYPLLSDEGTISVTEVIPDPCYITKNSFNIFLKRMVLKEVSCF